jgi:hypothetical protein
MIRDAEDLPQRALYRAVPEARRNQRRPKSRWADGINSDSRVLGGGVTGRASLEIEYTMKGSSQTDLDRILVVEPYKLVSN